MVTGLANISLSSCLSCGIKKYRHFHRRGANSRAEESGLRERGSIQVVSYSYVGLYGNDMSEIDAMNLYGYPPIKNNA